MVLLILVEFCCFIGDSLRKIGLLFLNLHNLTLQAFCLALFAPDG